MEDAGRWALAHRARPAQPGRRPAPRPSSTSRAGCCCATASCSGACSSARPTGCRRGATCLRVYRRLEARGEIRGGRFVAGFSGEQFALPDAVGMLREVRRQPASDAWVSLSGADPLNLVGILTPGAEARRADRQPRALPERPADRGARRRRGAVSREAGPRQRNGRPARPCCEAPCRRRSSIWPEACAADGTDVRADCHCWTVLPACADCLPRAGHPREHPRRVRVSARNAGAAGAPLPVRWAEQRHLFIVRQATAAAPPLANSTSTRR